MNVRIALAFIGLGLISVGPTAILAPNVASMAFGIPADTPEASAYLLAAATRDVALGGWLLGLLALRAGGRALAASMLAIALVAAGDALNVFTYSNGRLAPALVVHVTGFGVLLGLGIYFLRVPSD